MHRLLKIPPQNKTKKKQGFSLLETMIAVVLFSLIAIGTTAAIIQSQKIALSNVMRSNAFNIVDGYMEQIRQVSASQLRSSLASPGTDPIPTIKLNELVTSSTPQDLEVSDPLYVGQENIKQVAIDVNEDDPSNPSLMMMEVRITPTITDLDDSATYGSNAIPAIEVVLAFEYEVRHKRGTVRDSGSMRTIIADV